jgi:hypothetical protein
MSNSVDNRPQEASDRGSAVRTSMLLVGVLVAGVSLLHLPTSLMSQANTQVEAGPPIVKASDKWIRLGVHASGQMPAALSQLRGHPAHRTKTDKAKAVSSGVKLIEKHRFEIAQRT